MRFLALIILCIAFATSPAQAQTKRIVALGDSLTAGYGLPKGDDFATKLQEYLRGQGHDVIVDNAGISGDTTEDGLRRLSLALAGEQKPDLVIVALGANDMLGRLPPERAKKNLSEILSQLSRQDIAALLVGMKNPQSFGPFMKSPYEAIYKDLAKEHDVKLIPFFLEGVAMKSDLNLPDGLHPNQKGVAVMVEHVGPTVEKLID